MNRRGNLRIKNNAMLKVGEALRKLRKARKISIEDLAADAGISAPALSHIENSQVEQPNLATLKKLLTALNEREDVLFSESKLILEGYGYKSHSGLPNATDIKQAIKAWAVPFKSTALPAYLVDYAQRVHDMNNVALSFLGVDTENENIAEWTVFDLAFSERLQNNITITNRDEFIVQMVRTMKSEFAPLMAENWCTDCICNAQNKYPMFKTIWETIQAAELPEVGVRTMGPICLSISGFGNLSFDLVGTDLISDPRFRAIQYIPRDAETYEKCFHLIEVLNL